MAEETGKSKDVGSVKEWGNALMVAVIVTVAVTIAASVGIYILGAFNNTGTITIPGTYNLLKPVASFFPVIGVIIGIFILIIVVVAMLRKLGEAQGVV